MGEMISHMNGLTQKVHQLTQMIHSANEVIAHFVILQSVLVDKGIISELELSIEYERAREKTKQALKEQEGSKQNPSTGDSEDRPVQPEGTGTPEDSSGDGRPSLLRTESGGVDSGSQGAEVSESTGRPNLSLVRPEDDNSEKGADAGDSVDDVT